MGKKRKNRYRWTCTGCGQEIEHLPDGDDLEVIDGARIQLMEAAGEHLKRCPKARFEDVDGYYVADACCNPYVRPNVRRIRKLAFMRVGRNKTLHIDYGAEHVPCGLGVAQQDATEVHVADFYGGRVPKLRLCKTCIAYLRPGIAGEMEILEAQFRSPVVKV